MTSVETEKRIRNELKNLKKMNIDNIQIIQDPSDKFVFYFLLKGLEKSDYEGGLYVGKITLPEDYPKNPVDYKMLTPSGRFEINKSICLTNSKYHKESWSPSWNLENMTIGFISIFSDDTEKGISHIKDTKQNRQKFAKDSIKYNMDHHREIFTSFDLFVNSDGTVKTKEEIAEARLAMKNEKPEKKKKEKKEKVVEVEVEEPVKEVEDNSLFESLLG